MQKKHFEHFKMSYQERENLRSIVTVMLSNLRNRFKRRGLTISADDELTLRLIAAKTLCRKPYKLNESDVWIMLEISTEAHDELCKLNPDGYEEYFKTLMTLPAVVAV
ncbi:hypothetical protein [Enterovibrio norvegicus]|uniref:hypothetical protein n=1 Tax=Enterovibrio norvegicus TaxID=188144 RepID=UPI000C837EB4|nr:hypothetical protein [Enterovibrio norvegicus]PMN64312.1 hypothetical protein BCT27_10125 [Enterovibrio norvegicus]